MLFILSDLGTAGRQYWCLVAAVIIIAAISARGFNNFYVIKSFKFYNIKDFFEYRLFVLYGTFFCIFCIYAAVKSAPTQINPNVDEYNKIPASVTGVVARASETDYGMSYMLSDCIVETESGSSYENVLVYANNEMTGEHIYEGARVKICGTLRKFERARNDGGFDAAVYYRSIGIAYRLSAEKIQVTGENNSVECFASKLRDAVDRQYEKIADEETCEVLRAVLLGDKSTLSDDTYELYQKNGIAHILAISGLHISFLASLMYTMMRRAGIGFFPAFALCASMLALYCIMTGNAVSAKRAVIMYIIKMGAELLGRSYDTLSALAAAALLVCFENIYVIYNAGFQLSFGAILGMAALCPAMERILPSRLRKNRLVLSAVGSMGVSIFTMPVILYHYFELPVYAALLNMLLIPLVSLLMLCAAAAGALSLISVHAGVFLVGTVHYILKFYSFLCVTVQSFPQSRVVPGRPSFMQCVVFYCIVLIFIFVVLKIKKLTSKIKSIFCAGILFSCVFLNIRPEFDLSVDMIDVGQGDSILVCTGTGETFLFDGGSSDIKNVGEKRIFPVLRSNGITDIDCIFVSHSDADHINGVQELINLQDDTFRIHRLILPQIINTENDKAYTELVSAAEQHGIEVRYAYAGMTVVSVKGSETKSGCKEKFSVECIHPQKNYQYSDSNDYSAVYLLSCGGFKMLMTGDAEEKAEKAFLENGEVSGLLSGISVLKAGHHGSAASGSEALLQKINPRVSFISCGIDNMYGHPAEITIERLKKYGSDIYVTSKCGQIKLRLKGNDFYILTKLEA